MAKEERDSYAWRGEEVRKSGPADESYDPDEAQKRREARSVPKDSKPKVK
jgi:hypothetical protein